MKTSVKFLIIFGIVLALGLASIAIFGGDLSFLFRPTESTLPEGVTKPEITPDVSTNEPVRVFAKDLSVPWEILFVPNDDTTLVTERVGNLKIIGKENTKTIPVSGVYATGEGGLLGAALHPRFTENRFLYLYFTSGSSGDVYNRVMRYRFKDDALTDPKVIADRLPGSSVHNGGRIAFGPDGYLYIGTGDGGKSELAQEKSSLAGKILRVADDGTIPESNPFGNAVYSYGHRNVQGLAWDGEGRLWATEHGRSGVQSGLDEVNHIKAGENYGWPVIEGDSRKSGMQTPVINSGEKETWAPASIIFYRGKLYFVGLRGESLYEVMVSADGKLSGLKADFRQEFGRLRALKIGPDGAIYMSTSNTDGRGKARDNDDKILRLTPTALGF